MARRQERRRGQVVDQDAGEGRHGGGGPRIEMGEQGGGARPRPPQRAQGHGQAEERDEDRDAEDLECGPGGGLPSAVPAPSEQHGDHADGGHRERRRAEHHDEHRDDGHRHEADAEHGAFQLGRGGDGRAQGAVVHGADDQRGDDGGGQRRQRHVGEEGAPGEMEVAEDDQVREVRAGQEQRPGVGEEQAGVEERRFPLAAAAGGVDEDWCEEGDRRVEVQQGGDRDDEHGGPRVQQDAVGGQAGQGVATGGEQPVPVGHETDQEQPGDEHEGRPVLRGRCPGMLRGERDGSQDEPAAGRSRSPAQRGPGGRRAVPVVDADHRRSVPLRRGPETPASPGPAHHDGSMPETPGSSGNRWRRRAGDPAWRAPVASAR